MTLHSNIKNLHQKKGNTKFPKEDCLKKRILEGALRICLKKNMYCQGNWLYRNYIFILKENHIMQFSFFFKLKFYVSNFLKVFFLILHKN